MVLVHYSVRENDPEKLVEIVLNPIERSMQKLNRVVEIKSTASHGVVDVEIGFEGTVTTQDLAAVTARIEMLKLDKGLVLLSRVIEMRQRFFNNASIPIGHVQPYATSVFREAPDNEEVFYSCFQRMASRFLDNGLRYNGHGWSGRDRQELVYDRWAWQFYRFFKQRS